MTFTPASPASLIAFLGIVVGVLGAIVAGVFVVCRRANESPTRPMWVSAAVLLAVMIVTSVAVGSGAIAARPMPGVPIFFGLSLLGAIAFALSPVGRRLATLPLWALVLFQSFRLPLELVLHAWAEGGTIPSTMTWTGQNFDIIAGITALVAAPLAARWRLAAWIANVVGLALLLNVIRVAAMSAPLPFGWHLANPLQIMLHLPYAFIVPICVGGALLGHVVLTRALLHHPPLPSASP